MAKLEPGAKAPDFVLPTAGGAPVRLKDLRGRKVVLYFYPKDNTSGCTREACSFRDNLGALEEKGAVVIGVSADSADSHRNFALKHGISFALASDEQKEVVKAYGVWKQKSMYGRTFQGIERTTFVIDERGKIARIFPRVKVQGHVEEVLAAL
jgi:peroxiredoxin Q/BCP